MPPVNLLFLEVTLSPSASMLGIIVLLESMLYWVILHNERNQCFVQMSVYLVAVSIPVKMTRAVAPLADIPPQTFTFGRCFGRLTITDQLSFSAECDLPM